MDQREMSLRDTIPMMESDNYKDRFKAEFYQLKIRINKLTNMLSAWATGELGFQPSCPYELLESLKQIDSNMDENKKEMPSC